MATPGKPTTRIFCLNVDEDEKLVQELKDHLIPLTRQGLIVIWSPHQVKPGKVSMKDIEARLETADIILLLVSAKFMRSNLHHTWMQKALERQEACKVSTIPILLSPIASPEESPFAQLRALPKSDRPVTKWRNRDEAWTKIVEDIRKVVVAQQKNEDEKQDNDRKGWTEEIAAIAQKPPKMPLSSSANEQGLNKKEDTKQASESVPTNRSDSTLLQPRKEMLSLKRLATIVFIILLCTASLFGVFPYIANVKNGPGVPASVPSKMTSHSTFPPTRTHPSTPISTLPPQVTQPLSASPEATKSLPASPQSTQSLPASPQPTFIPSTLTSASDTLNGYCQSLLQGSWQNGKWASNAHQFIASARLTYVADSTSKPQPPAETYTTCQLQTDSSDHISCPYSREIYVIAIAYSDTGTYYRDFFVQKVNIGWVITDEGDLGGANDRKYPGLGDCNNNNVVSDDASVG